MDSSIQIRKLPVRVKSELSAILDFQESWKKLMAIIPDSVMQANYKCDISINNLAKYRSEHFRMIENHAFKYQKSCTEVLLREWGTSGRVLPRLGHLQYLLEKAELFRAADYISVEVLQQQPPQRPSKGPAARVVLNSDELEDTETKRIERMLDQIDYPSSAIENINKLNSINTNINYSVHEKTPVIPEIVISESPDVEEPVPSFNVPLVIQNPKSKSETDLIKFSTNSVPSSESDNNVNLPHLSSLLDNSEPINLPVVVEDFTSSSVESNSEEVNMPQLSSLLNNSRENLNMPNLSELSVESYEERSTNLNMPNLSELSALSLEEGSTNLPAFSQLIQNVDVKTLSTKNSTPSRSCTSPLPNLSLNTLLPHFTYTQLEHATDNFDETPLTQSGRFLGSGAFGKVYLAVGLFTRPVAVKKLLLDNVDEVHVDDTITRQFRNEVEVLSKYKHENLLSLLGYSCDGCTYCLLYEYIPGGALKDRLEKRELIWTERLYIAIGTAKAISYLHTAFSTPLIHRDVKSANILLDFANKPKLCDFGLIKLSPSQNTSTGTTIFGTSAYMAPEAFRGDISTKLDTFSFGVVLLELLTSLAPVDETREGVDLVTHIEENCDNDITPLLDTSVGGWVANEIHFGQELFKIASQCLEEKKKRPTMEKICQNLAELVQKSL